MSETGDTADAAATTEAMEAGFVRVLSDRIRFVSDSPKQMREMVYELARIKLLEQFTHEDARRARPILQALDRATQAVEEAFDRDVSSPPDIPQTTASEPPATTGRTSTLLQRIEGELRQIATPSPRSDRPKKSGTFNSILRLAVLLLFVAIVGAAVAYWRVGPQFAAPTQRSATIAQPEPAPAALPPASEPAERLPDTSKESTQANQPSMPLPTTFGVYALSDGQLQELKAVPGKVPDRRVAISAPITTPSAATVSSGDVKFIVFRPDGSIDARGTEVRVVARVSRAMGIDATGKAAMTNAGDSWVIRSMSHPYKVGPIEDQPKMLLLQPEQDTFALTPGRYIVVVRGIGYDFTVAGSVTDPDQCVERINATNGAFYSPCPPPR